MFTLTPIVAALVASTIVNVAVSYISWRRRKTKGSTYFALAMFAVTLWTLASALDYAAVPLHLKIFFAKIEALGYHSDLALFAVFSAYYAGYDRWLEKKRGKALFFFIPLTNILLTFTNELHHSIWTGFIRKAGNVVVFEHGPAFNWTIITSYVLAIFIFVNLWTASRKGSEFARRQARILMFALLFPIAINLLYREGAWGIEGVDWSSITFSISGVLFLYALYGTRLLDIVPIARDKLASSLSDGMIVLDTQNRIVDINQPAVSAFDAALDSLIGKNLAAIAPLSRPLLEQNIEREVKTEFEVGRKTKRYFEALITPLREERKIIIGRLMIFRDITERRQTELALRESDERYQAFITQSFEAIYRTEFDQPIDTSLPVEEQIDLIYERAYMAECNQALADMYGLPSSQSLIGTRLMDAHGGKDNPVNRAAFRKFIEGGYKSTDDETVEVGADGNPVWFLSNTIGILKDRQLLRLWGTSIDISERKMAEAALRASEERFRQLMISAPDAVFGVNGAGSISFANEAATKLLGYSLNELIGMGVDDLVPPRLREGHAAQRAGYTSNPRSRFMGSGLDLVAVHKDGSEIPVDIKLSQIQTDAGILTIAFMRDITEQKLAEGRLRQQAEYIEHAHAAIITRDMQGYIRYWNPRAIQIYGWAGKEVIGRLAQEVLETQYPISRQEAEQVLLETGHWEGELTQVCKDGRRLAISSHQALQRDAMGITVAILEINLDITERVQKDAALREAQSQIVNQQRAIAAMEERQRLGRDMHDSVNQSIHSLTLSTQTLTALIQKGQTEQAAQIAERIQESGRQALKEIRLLIYEARLQAADQDADLIHVLEERLNMVERRAGIKAGVFCEKGTLEYIPAEWNEDLHWLIVEALNNSLKHAQAREVAITIKSAKKNLEVEVRDNGKGFDVRRIHAGGFGMRTMRERAKIMGGTLKVKSSSEGTSVYFKARIQKPLESRRP